MVKVELEKHIVVTMTMTFAEALELRESLNGAPGSYNHWNALDDAIRAAELSK